jgi:hypothetical protein
MTSLFNRSLTRALLAALVAAVAARSFAQPPQMPAAPLAGGAAAIGNSYVDVHGNPIVMPASYTEPANFMEPSGNYCGYAGCPGGCGGGTGINGGDPGAAYVDYGGYSMPDQCGPYYFDIAVGTVILRGDHLFGDVPSLGSIGPSGPGILRPGDFNKDYTPGWQIAARYDLGPLSLLEATYMGIYDFDFSQTVRSVDVAPGGLDDFLYSAFSNYGDPVAVPGLDQGSVYSINYQSDLQSTELSYRRYWLGYSPRVSGTLLAGFRYIRMTDDFQFNALTEATSLDPRTSSLTWSADNDMCGAQFGGDGWVCLRQGLRFGGETKAGIYNNRYKYRHTTNIDNDVADEINQSVAGNQVAFAGELGLSLVADILPSFSIKAGYQALYLSSLVTSGNNINTTNVNSTAVLTQADAIYHGFQAGLEYIW